MEDIPGCNVAPSLPKPGKAVDWFIYRPILGVTKDLSSLNWLLLMAFALKNTKSSKSSLRAASTLEQF